MASGYDEEILENGIGYQRREIQEIKIVEI
jgi:hypothetical protein